MAFDVKNFHCSPDCFPASREQERAYPVFSYSDQLERLRQKEEYRRVQEVLNHVREDDLTMFLKSEGYFCFDTQGRISSQEIYGIYKRWCEEHKLLPRQPRSLWLHLKRNASQYRIAPTTFVQADGRKARGFRGIRHCTKEEAENRTVFRR